MNDKIFRKNSIDRVSSPEQLDDYIKVSNPGIWMLLTAICVLLTGICVWGITGKIDTKIKTAAFSQNGVVLCYVSEENRSSIKEDMPVKIGDNEYTVKEISSVPIKLDEKKTNIFCMWAVFQKMNGCMEL